MNGKDVEEISKYTSEYINKKLIAQFVASATDCGISIDTIDLDAFESNELNDEYYNILIEAKSLAFESDNMKMYAIPGFNRKRSKYELYCYRYENNGSILGGSVLTWQELSDTLEKQEWNGDWVSDSDVEKVMKYIDWNNIEGND